ncbi:uncharacterized protein RJT20DRAFT_49572 [Scheffersomyces xylosifermentans]|uniref:uncharacterized protein n=1 Tax=Scheffersomyces xylosifermentans TaxID=1304137 RepID=UPI00315DE3E2
MNASSHAQVVTLKVTHNRLTAPGNQTVEKSIAIDRSKFLKIKTKENLTEILSRTELEIPHVSSSLLKYLRKSKKHKEYIPLETEDDFKSLSRSLKVKNHVKLIINDSSPFVDGHFKKRKTSTIDFSSLGDALLEAAFDHFKDLFADLPKAASSNENSSFEHGKDSPDGDHKQAGQNSTEELPIHVNVACDSCNPTDTSFVPIRGVRYSCLVCPNFDLCESCEADCTRQKRTVGVHSFMHPMAKLSSPDQDFNRKKFNLGSRGCRTWKMPSQLPPSYSRDIVYDIPLENCTDQTKQRLETLLQKNGIDSFIHNVQKFIDNSDRYEELIALSQRNSDDREVDEEVKFAILKSMIDSCLATSPSMTTQAPTSSIPETTRAPFESVPAHCSDKVLVKPKKIGDNARVISLMLTNTSEVTIEGGDLKFEFHNDKQNEVVIIKNASNVKPGQQRFYNLGKLNDNFDRLSGMKLTVTSSNVVLEGEYHETEDSELWIVQNTATSSPCVEDAPNTNIGNSQVLDNNDEINVTVVPKSSTAAQIIISNRSKKTIDCSYLKLEIVNCFNRSVVTVIVRKKHGILPGKVGKFNIGLVDAHMKYPFKLVMKNDFNVGYCDLNFKKLSDNLIFEKEGNTYIKKEHYISDDEDVRTSGTESFSDEKLQKEEEMTDEDTIQKEPRTGVPSLSSSLNQSVHSIVLPALPKESTLGGSSEYLDARASLGKEKEETELDENEEDDYDIISVEGDPETDSDFEVLSPVISSQ